MAKDKFKNNKQVLFQNDADTMVVARTPITSGLTLSTLIEALVEVQQRLGMKNADNPVVIFEDSESETSWTIQQVAFDQAWVRLS